jgi:hypothetical protein
MGGGGNEGLEAVATSRASHAPVGDRQHEREAAEGAGDEEGGGRPLLLNDGIKLSRGRRGKVDGAESASGLDQLHQFGVAGEKPLGTEGTGESRLESERGARGVDVQDGSRARGDREKGGVRRVEPGGGGRSQGGQRGAGVRGGGHPLKLQRVREGGHSLKRQRARERGEPHRREKEKRTRKMHDGIGQ